MAASKKGLSNKKAQVTEQVVDQAEANSAPRLEKTSLFRVDLIVSETYTNSTPDEHNVVNEKREVSAFISAASAAAVYANLELITDQVRTGYKNPQAITSIEVGGVVNLSSHTQAFKLL